MKKTTPILLLVFFLFFNLTNCFAQYYKYAIDANYGISGVTDPSIQDFSHFGAGFTYEFDVIYGIKLDFGSDQYRMFNTIVGKEAGVDMLRLSLQGVVNLSTVGDEYRIYDTFNILAHGGIGVSKVSSTILEGSDKTVNFILGITPRLKITDELYFNVDASAIMIFSQHYNFDGNLAYDDVVNSFSSFTYNFTAGLTYRFGKY